jgi:DNA invertase Pin-like site-specific DNA recombinase
MKRMASPVKDLTVPVQKSKGDVLVVTRLDRLARSTRDLLNLLGTIAEKGAALDRSETLGGHDDSARPSHADRIGWSCRV